jgi:hypothetical protein
MIRCHRNQRDGGSSQVGDRRKEIRGEAELGFGRLCGIAGDVDQNLEARIEIFQKI